MKLSKVILLSTACSFCNAADCSYAAYNTSESLSLISTSGIHTYHTQHLTDETPFLPHPRAQFGNQWRHPRRHSQSDATHPGNTGENIESLSNLDVRIKSEHDIRVASVCFITDTRACSGEKFSNDETPGNGNGNPSGIPDYDTPQEQCQAAGYNVTSCPTGSHGDNPCPADSSYYQKCVCDANMTETCTKPYYGVGPSCDGKYASCKRDDAKACKEDGYGQTAQCSSVQTPNKKCPYDSAYYDKCVCRSDLVTCTYPQSGVGEACGGKYASCQCPSSYKSCECGGAAGATSCTVNGVTTYSDCKKCCTTSCPAGYDYTESQLTGANGNGWVKDGNDYCDHCTRGRLYKRKAATCPGYTETCTSGVYNPGDYCQSGNTKKYKPENCKPCVPSCKDTAEYENGCPACKMGHRFASDGCGGSCYQCSEWIEKTCWTTCRNFEREEGVFCGEWIMVDYLSCGGTKPSQRGNERQCNFGWNPTVDMCGKYNDYMSSRKC